MRRSSIPSLTRGTRPARSFARLDFWTSKHRIISGRRRAEQHKHFSLIVVVHVVSLCGLLFLDYCRANRALQERQRQLCDLFVDGLSPDPSPPLRRRRRTLFAFRPRSQRSKQPLQHLGQLRERHRSKRLGFYTRRESFQPR